MVLARFTRLEFEAVDGRIRSFYGCSVVGAIEFDERLEELRQALKGQSDGGSTEALYRDDKWIRHLIDRCLELNGIDPSWVTWEMVSQLLFGRTVDGQAREGYLVELNRPEGVRNVGDASVPLSSRSEVLAAIASHCGSLEGAYRLAETVPSRELWAVLEKKNEFAKPPEERAKAEKESRFKRWVERRKAQQRETG